MLAYYLKAALFGAGWYLVLLIPSWTRAWLMADPGAVWWHILSLVISSVIMARLFRRYIWSADTLGDHLIRAAVLPYVGCFFYLTVWNIFVWTEALLFGGFAHIYDTLILYPWGISHALLAFFIVIPYGILCQFGLNRALESIDPNKIW